MNLLRLWPLAVAASSALARHQLLGVPETKHEMYSLEPNALFACLDGSKSIPATSINDDFCDCYDGSDEPGTSACNDTFFYCNNAGHIGSFIPSSRVNDGICDPECCDGSDEYLGIIKCPDVCAKVGAEFKKAELEKQRVLQKGIKVKKEYLTYAINAKHVRAKQIIDLEVDIWNITSRIEELKVIRNEAEAYENHVNALMAQQSLEEAQAVMPQQLAECTQRKNVLRSNIDTLNSRINELQSILDNLMKLKDAEEGAAFEALLRDKPILKETLQQYDDFKRNLEDGRGAIALEAEPEVSIIDESATGGVDRATLTDPCIDPTASTVRCVLGSARGLLLGSYGAIKYPFVWPGWRKLYSSLRNPFIRLSRSEENELLRKDASKARSHLLDAENKKRDLETKIADLKKKSELDMGPNNVWDKLVGTCFEIKSFEYFYEICILDKAVQRPINGGSSTDLGKFSRWGSRKDDKMTESTGKYLFMMFENGAHCWNGPHRSVEVAFECGSENKVMSVAEPSKCEYAMRVQTPAVCEESADTYHNEL